MTKLVWVFLSAFVAMIAPANAQPCNSPSGFIQSYGNFTIGDTTIFGPDCNHIQDSGVSLSGGSFINVKSFGAKGDGTTDDSAAIMAADAAAASAGKCVYFPASTYITAITLNPVRSSLCWFGDSRYLSIIKMQSGSAFDTVAWFGPRTLTTQITNNYVHDLQFNGNGFAANAVVEIRNMTFSTFQNLLITQGVSHGFRGETSTTTINTVLVRNHYIGIETSSNGGKGFYLSGDKDSEIAEIFSHNNTGDGLYFGPANLNSSALCETTQLYGGHISSRDNGGDGIVFDEAEKYAFSSVQTSINAGYGVRFKSTFTGCTSTGSNSVSIADIVARNDALGAFRVSDGAYMYGAKFGTVWIRGDNSNVGSIGMQLDGVQSTQWGEVEIEGWPGQAMVIQSGTPLSLAHESDHLQFSSLILRSNGNGGAANNSGLTVSNTSAKIEIGNLVSENNNTGGGSSFELVLANTVSQFNIANAIINSTPAGNELSVGTSDIVISLRRTGANTFLSNNLAWTAFAPALTCGTATFTVNGARSKRMVLEKTTFIELDFTVTAAGTCTHPITFTLPSIANAAGGFSGMEIITSGNSVFCQITVGSATASCFRNFNNFTTTDRVIAAGVYEHQ